MRGVVPRSDQIRYRGFDPFGHPIDRVASGFHARVVQHECDHLDGILILDRVKSLALDVFPRKKRSGKRK